MRHRHHRRGWITRLFVFAMMLAAGGAAAQQPLVVRQAGEIVTLRGGCDASAIVFVPRSSPPLRLVLVDERPQLLAFSGDGAEGAALQDAAEAILRRDDALLEALRPAGDPGRAVVREGSESDLEGAAWLGDRLYLVTSHGRSSKGERRPRRERLVALTVTQGPGGATIAEAAVGTRYPHLLRDLATLPLLRTAIDTGDGTVERLRPEQDGLNIEGLAAGADGTSLLLGLRNPMAPGGLAIIVPLLNPGDLRPDADGPRARFGEPILLDLGGRAIRSIEWVPERRLYLIVAGPSGEGSAFALYGWGGPGSAAPQRIRGDEAITLPQADPFRPEGLAVEPGGNALVLVSDDGDRMVNGERCKDIRPRTNGRFRLMRLTLE